jgi:gamma-butyrobetaine dioxygenase/trimethyllysine dioxygenase
MSPSPTITALQHLPNALRITYASPQAPPSTLDFHYFWLRHRCPDSVHPQTRERTLCSSEVPLDITPAHTSTSPNGDALTIQWDTPDRHTSTFSLAWLIAHAYAVNQPLPQPAPVRVEDVLLSATAPIPTILTRLRSHGLAVLPSVGDDTEAFIDQLAAHGLLIRDTHFGRIEDLRTDNTTNQNTDQLGYTNAEVNLHTDQPFLANPPRYQLLHCIQRATSGGDNAVVDAFAAAEYLRLTDAPTFDLLASVPVHFHRKQQRFESSHISPTFELAHDGSLRRVRFSYFTTAPQRLPFSQMTAWYEAFNRFTRFVRDPAHQYRVALQPGDLLIYDNWRMLHARTAFSGPRWMRGVYFDPAPDATLFPTP